jgi:hypothetical protein
MLFLLSIFSFLILLKSSYFNNKFFISFCGSTVMIMIAVLLCRFRTLESINSTLFISKATIEKYTAVTSGGAVFIDIASADSITISTNGSTFTECSASLGGAFFLTIDSSIRATIGFSFCNWTACSAAALGGAVSITHVSTQESFYPFTKCAILRSEAASGGGIAFRTSSMESSTIQLKDSEFTMCQAVPGNGGSVFIVSTNSWINSDAMVVSSSFLSSSARGDGGALWLRPAGVDGLALDVRLSNFTQCTALKSSGAIYVYAVAPLGATETSFSRNMTLSVYNCGFFDGYAPVGSAINFDSALGVTRLVADLNRVVIDGSLLPSRESVLVFAAASIEDFQGGPGMFVISLTNVSLQNVAGTKALLQVTVSKNASTPYNAVLGLNQSYWDSSSPFLLWSPFEKTPTIDGSCDAGYNFTQANGCVSASKFFFVYCAP